MFGGYAFGGGYFAFAPPPLTDGDTPVSHRGYPIPAPEVMKFGRLPLAQDTPMFFSQGFSAALSFTGSQIKQTTYPLVAAVLSFTGSIGKITKLPLTGGLSFTGAIKKLNSIPLTGGLTFTGAISKSTKYVMTAGLSFTGAIKKLSGIPLVGGLSFNTTFVAGARVMFTAALNFAGNLNKKTTTSFSGVLSFVGSMGRGFFVYMTAALSFLGSWNQSANTEATGTVWYQNPEYLVGTVDYDDPNTFFDAVYPFDGAITQNITSVYPQAAQLWEPQVLDTPDTMWSQNPEYFLGAVLYDDPNTLFDALIPFDSSTPENLVPTYPTNDTIWEEPNSL